MSNENKNNAALQNMKLKIKAEDSEEVKSASAKTCANKAPIKNAYKKHVQSVHIKTTSDCDQRGEHAARMSNLNAPVEIVHEGLEIQLSIPAFTPAPLLVPIKDDRATDAAAKIPIVDKAKAAAHKVLTYKELAFKKIDARKDKLSATTAIKARKIKEEPDVQVKTRNNI